MDLRPIKIFGFLSKVPNTKILKLISIGGLNAGN